MIEIALAIGFVYLIIYVAARIQIYFADEERKYKEAKERIDAEEEEKEE